MKVRRIDFSPDEWLAGTGELSAVDRGVYITICALIYSRGGPIEFEVIRRHIPEHGTRVKAAVDRLEMMGKIVRNGSEIDQKRCENELENARKRSEKASENGRIGNEIKALKIATRESAALATPHANHQPSTTSKENPNLSVGSKENGAKRRAQIPADWFPNPTDAAFAADQTKWPPDRVAAEAEHFRDHHRSNGKTFLDISAAWRTWCRNGAAFQRNGHGNGATKNEARKPITSQAQWDAMSDAERGQYIPGYIRPI